MSIVLVLVIGLLVRVGPSAEESHTALSYMKKQHSVPLFLDSGVFNSRKGQRTNQKYRNLVGSDQLMQGLKKLNLERLTVWLGLAFIFSNISSGMA